MAEAAHEDNYPSTYPQATPGSSLDIVFRALYAAGSEFEDGADWTCPIHDDQHASLGVHAGADRGSPYAVLVHCPVCSTHFDNSKVFVEQFARVLGISTDVLTYEQGPRSHVLTPGERQAHGYSRHTKAREGELQAIYEYRLSDGATCLRVLRYVDERGRKFFRQQRVNGYGQALFGLKPETPRPAYKLPLLDRIWADCERTGVTDEDWPVLFVTEGEKACEAVWAAGAAATCFAGGSNAKDEWIDEGVADLGRARYVSIIADRDESGVAYAWRVYDAFRRAFGSNIKLKVVQSATLEKGDDVVEHLEAGHSLDELIRIKRKSGGGSVTPIRPDVKVEPDVEVPSEKHWPAPEEPVKVARHFINRFYPAIEGKSIFSTYNDDFFAWDAEQNRWVEITTARLRHEVQDALERARYVKVRDGEEVLVPWCPTKPKIDLIVDALRNATWQASDPIDGKLIHFKNGNLDLRDGSFSRPTPHNFNLNSLPYLYESDNHSHPEWDRFLTSLWGADSDEALLLQEWFGYVLSGAVDHHKALMMVGPPRSGKSTISRVLSELVGREAVAAPTMMSLASNFGLASLIGKPLAIIGDARMGHRGSTEVVERLLAIIGRDSLDVDRKNKSIWTGRLPCRIVLMSNELPRLIENSGALAARFLTLVMSESFLGREDRDLENRLLAECPAIVNWALEGYRRLLDVGRFTLPESSYRADRELLEFTSPVRRFVLECCDFDEDSTITLADAYDAYKLWCEDEGMRADSKTMLTRNVKTAFPSVRNEIRYSKSLGKPERMLVGLKLKV